MAHTSTIDDARIWINDLFTGAAQFLGMRPTYSTGGLLLTNPTHQNVATRYYDPGYTIEIFDSTKNAWCKFAYMQVGSVSGTHSIAAKTICGLEIDSSVFTGKVSNDTQNSKVALGGPCLIALSAMTDEYWGFFQVAGPIAVGLLSTLDGNFDTDGNVAVAGGAVSLVDDDNAAAFGVATAVKSQVAFVSSNDAA